VPISFTLDFFSKTNILKTHFPRGATVERNTAPHFHIRWTIGEIIRIDWEPFASRDEAERMAKRLITTADAYTIVEFDASCEQCAMFQLKRRISN